MIRYILLIAVFFSWQHLIAQTSEISLSIEIESNGIFIDHRDNKEYKWIKIGNQVWMAENLKATQYLDGTEITEVAASSIWSDLKTGAYCYNYSITSNAEIYGPLYNWHAVDDSRGLCPAGWQVPTDAEWKQLEMYLGMSKYGADNIGFRGTDEGNKLKSTTGWYKDGIDTNKNGFLALPGGYRSINGTFFSIGIHGYWWSSTEDNSFTSWYRYLYYSNAEVHRSSYSKHYDFSVRCLND